MSKLTSSKQQSKLLLNRHSNSSSHKRVSGNKSHHHMPSDHNLYYNYPNHRESRKKSKFCNTLYLSQGSTSDPATPSSTNKRNPYQAMRENLQMMINKNQAIEKRLSMLDLTGKTLTSPTGITTAPVRTADEPSATASSTAVSPGAARAATPSKSPSASLQMDTPTDNTADTEDNNNTMVCNEDDEEYQKEDDVERIMTQTATVDSLKNESIIEQMRRVQVSTMEKIAKNVEPKDIMNYFKSEGYFNYYYDNDARATPVNTGNGTKKDYLYVFVGKSSGKKRESKDN